MVPLQELWLFPGRRPGKPMTPRQLNRLFHEAADAARIKKNMTLHAFGEPLPLMLKTAANSGGLPMKAFDDIRAGVLVTARAILQRSHAPVLRLQPAKCEGVRGLARGARCSGLLAGDLVMPPRDEARIISKYLNVGACRLRTVPLPFS
jgi:hypothetical protein